MPYTEKYPLNPTPQGDSTKEAVLKNREEIKTIGNALSAQSKGGGSGLRQRILYGKNSGGKYSFLSGDGLSVIIDGSKIPVILTLADGFDENGAKDYVETINKKISAWTLPINATSYLFVERNNVGSLSYGSVTTKPVFSDSLPSGIVTNTHVFNTLEQKMYVYNGTGWKAAWRVFIAAVTTNATNVTKIEYMNNAASVEMTADEKEKLSGIAAGAEVNQNTFESVHVGDQYVIAREKKDSLELRPGTNIQLIPDGDNQCVTVNVTGTVSSASRAETAGRSDSAGRADSAGYADKAACDRHGVIIDTGYSKFGYALIEALQNGPLQDALQVDIHNQYSDFNKMHTVVDSITKINMPDSVAWGVREVIFINENALIIRLTGLKTNATEIVTYYNAYNYGTWSGWVRQASIAELQNAVNSLTGSINNVNARIDNGEIRGGRIWFA